jgi:parvulin-like peptidyl-prolyl isomerase
MKIGPWIGTGGAMSVVLVAMLATGCQSGMRADKAPEQSRGLEQAGRADPEEAKHIVVARVNGAVITKYSLDMMMDRMAAINRETRPLVSVEEIREKALDQLIFQELSIQEAVRQGMSVKGAEIESGITAVMGHDTEDIETFLAKQNMTSGELRTEVERRILIQRIYTREVVDKVSITDDDVRREYERRKNELVFPEKVSVVDVAFLLKPDDQASQRKAEEVLAAITADKDKKPLNLAPDSAFTVKSLDLGKEQDPALYEAARKLKEGELSGLIKTPDSLHIIQLTKYTPGKQATYEEAKGPLKDKLRVEAQRKRFQEWQHELRDKATIEVLPGPERPQQGKP